MKQLIRNLLSITLVLLLSFSPSFAQRKGGGGGANRGGGGARTSVNRGGNVSNNANINSNRNVNVNSNRDVNIHRDVDIHGGYYGGGCCYHPIATAAAVTATAMVTAAVIGSMVNTLPPSCSVVMINGLTYQQCGSTWYQPQFVGSSPSYIVVVAPR